MANLLTPCGALQLQRIVYRHLDPGGARKALLFRNGVDRVDDIGRERYIDDNVQIAFEAIDQPRDLTGEAPNKRSLLRIGSRVSRATIGQ